MFSYCFGGYRHRDEECMACEDSGKCRRITDLLISGRIKEAFVATGMDKPLFMEIAEHYECLEIYEISIKIYEFLAELDVSKPIAERDPEPREQLYYIYKRCIGDEEKARKYFLEAVEILEKSFKIPKKSHEHIESWITLGYLWLDEDPEKAEGNFRFAISSMKHNYKLILANAYFGLGEALKKQGDIEKAMEMWDRARNSSLELYADIEFTRYTEIKNSRFWKVSVIDASVWEEWVNDGFCMINPETSELYCKSDDEFESEIEWFIEEVKPGDVLLACLGSKIVGIGKVLSKYLWLEEKHARKVHWIAFKEPIKLDKNSRTHRRISLNVVIMPLEDIKEEITSIIKEKHPKIFKELRIKIENRMKVEERR